MPMIFAFFVHYATSILSKTGTSGYTDLVKMKKKEKIRFLYFQIVIISIVLAVFVILMIRKIMINQINS